MFIYLSVYHFYDNCSGYKFKLEAGMENQYIPR